MRQLFPPTLYALKSEVEHSLITGNKNYAQASIQSLSTRKITNTNKAKSQTQMCKT
jgi:hypothetical protein